MRNTLNFITSFICNQKSGITAFPFSSYTFQSFSRSFKPQFGDISRKYQHVSDLARSFYVIPQLTRNFHKTTTKQTKKNSVNGTPLRLDTLAINRSNIIVSPGPLQRIQSLLTEKNAIFYTRNSKNIAQQKNPNMITWSTVPIQIAPKPVTIVEPKTDPNVEYQLDSTLRKRKTKMRRHKYKKRLKERRNERKKMGK